MRLHREDGAIVVEFVLILPIFLLILAGIMEFGLMLFNQQVLTNASREGARAGIILADPKPSEASIRSVVNTFLTNAGLTAANATVNVTGEGLGFGNDLTVRVDYLYNWGILRLTGGILTGGIVSIPLRASTTMKHE